MERGSPILFALNSSARIGTEVAAELGLQLSAHEEREFEDGEHKARPLVTVRDRDVYVIQSLSADSVASVNDKLCRLLFFLGTLHDASAARVTAVIPYLCYARKDRRTKARDPVTTRYVAQLFEAVGVDRVVTVDVHNPAAFQNAFRISTEHLTALPRLVDHFASVAAAGETAVVSPDLGGIHRMRAFRDSLAQRTGRNVAIAVLEKQRSEGVVSGDLFVGDVANRTVILIDDLISSGTTLVRAARTCRERGARSVIAAATHGVFAAAAERNLSDPVLDRIVVTNTIPPTRVSERFIQDRLTLLNISPLIAEAIHRMNTGAALTALNETRPSEKRNSV